MGATSGVSEPIVFAVTASRLLPLLLLLCALAAGLGVARLLVGPRLRGAGWALVGRAFLAVSLLGIVVCGIRAAVELASPSVQLKATERGLTSYMTEARPSSGVRLQLARHADAEGLFIPWRAMESIRVEQLRCYDDGGLVVSCDVLAITLRPGFEELRARGLVVVPGVRRSTLDLPVPVPPGGAALLAEVRALQQRFGGP